MVAAKLGKLKRGVVGSRGRWVGGRVLLVVAVERVWLAVVVVVLLQMLRVVHVGVVVGLVRGVAATEVVRRLKRVRVEVSDLAATPSAAASAVAASAAAPSVGTATAPSLGTAAATSVGTAAATSTATASGVTV